MAEKNVQILIVDDDPAYCRLIERYLGREGYRTLIAHDAETMRKHVDMATLVLLDLHLERSHGIDLARETREKYPGIGIIIVTGSTDEIDRIVGLEVGADDYVCKPFNERELLARIRSVLRRVDMGAETSSRVLKFHDFTLDLEARRLSRDGTAVELTGHEFNLLVMLAEKPNRVYTREEISLKVSAREWYPNDRSVDVLVSKLRKKLEADDDSAAIIKSLRGVGYQFSAKVEKG